jgi:hypothetical protein
VLLTAVLFRPVLAQQAAWSANQTTRLVAEKFSGAWAFSHVEELCKPEYSGRFTGHPGATRAAEWIGRQFAQWGLTPAGDDRSWLQAYPMLVTEQLERATLILRNGTYGRVEYQEGNDFTVYMNSGSGKIAAEVLFAGFGISEPAMGWDDFAGVDARGKILLIYRGQPGDGQDWDFANERDYKMRIAAAHGAAALLMLERGDWPIRGGTIHEEGYFPNLPAMNISKKIARDIFHGTFKDLDNLLRDLPQKPNSQLLNRTLQLQVTMRRIEPGRGENVVAMLRGSDPVLRDEYLVIGGHMDHNGLGRDGQLYAGADDNASGTAVVMELAHLFATLPERPKRSLIFVTFGGEEQGLRGSRYFAYHPPVPASRIAAMLNFDMEGTGDGGVSMGGRNYLPQVINSLSATWSDSLLGKTRFGRGWGGSGSDHFHFVEQGIPAIYFSSTGGHPFYHQMEDLPQTLNPVSLQSVGDRASALIHHLANWSEPLVLDGVGSGRFFLRHGDQLDLAGITLTSGEREYSRIVLAAHDLGIHFTTLSLNPPADPSECGLLFSRLDSLEKWIGRQQKHFIRYENAGAIDRAAGQAKVAVGIALRGTSGLDGSAALLGQLGRLGLNILSLADPADPLFAGKGIAPAGGELLQAAQSANLLLDVAMADTLLFDALQEAYKGRILWSVDWAQSAGKRGAIGRRLTGEKTLLILRFTPEDDLQALLDLALSLPANKVHLAILADGEPDAAGTIPATISALHKLLTAKTGGEQSYKLMEKWMGRNAKRMLPQDGGPRF